MRKLTKNNMSLVHFVPVLGFFYYVVRDLVKKKDSLHFLKQFVKDHPNEKFFVTNMGRNLHIILFDTILLKELLIQNLDKVKFPYKNMVSQPLIGEYNIFLSDGNNWKLRRKMLSYGFTFDTLRNFTPLMSEITDKYLLEMQKKSTSSVILLDYLNEITGEFMLQAILGSNLQSKKVEGKSLIYEQTVLNEHLFGRLMSPFFMFLGSWFFKYSWIKSHRTLNMKCKEMRQIIEDEVMRIKSEKEMNKTPITKESKLLDYMIDSMENNQDFKKSNISLTSEILTLLMAATETVSHSSLYTLMLLDEYPEVCEKLRKEIFESMIKENDYNYDKINSLQYLSAVIKESLRLRHSAPLGPPKCIAQDLKIGEYIFPANSNISLGIVCNLMNPKYFKDPDTFDPERWIIDGKLQDTIDNDPFIYIPFSMGPRNCIGQHFALMEAKTVLIKILKGYTFSVKNDKKKISWKMAQNYGPAEDIIFDIKKISNIN